MKNIALLKYLGSALIRFKDGHEEQARVYMDGDGNFYCDEGLVLLTTDKKEWVRDGAITKVIKVSDAEHHCHSVYYCPDKNDTYQFIRRWHPTNTNHEEYGIEIKK